MPFSSAWMSSEVATTQAAMEPSQKCGDWIAACCQSDVAMGKNSIAIDTTPNKSQGVAKKSRHRSKHSHKSASAAPPAAAATSPAPLPTATAPPSDVEALFADLKRAKAAAAAESVSERPSSLDAAAADTENPDDLVEFQGVVLKRGREFKPGSRTTAIDDATFFGTTSKKGRKKTEEGFKVYSETELQIGHGGDTVLCPFFCDCCF
jgi:hypothetical protein